MGFTPLSDAEKAEQKPKTGFVPLADAIKKQGKAGMSHTYDPPFKEVASAALGIDQYGDSDLSYIERASLSLGENDDEILFNLRQKNPKAEIRRVKTKRGDGLFYHRGDGDWKIVDERRASLKDTADLVGYLPEVLGGIAGTLASPGSPIAMGAVGTAAGHAAEEGFEWLLGIQGQKPADVAVDTLQEGLLDYGIGKAFSLARPAINYARGASAKDFDPQFQADMDLLEKVTRDGLEDPLASQLFVRQPGWRRAAMQGESVDSKAREILARQNASATEKLRGMADSGRSRTALGQELKQYADKAAKETTEGIRGRVDNFDDRTIGISIYQATKEHLGKMDAAQAAAWKKADKIADTEDLVFDITESKRVADNVYRSVPGIAEEPKEVLSPILNAKGENFVRELDLYVNAAKGAEDPNVRIARVAKILGELAPEQTNYRVLKELRTRVGRELATAPWNRNLNTDTASKLYGALTDGLKSSGSKEFTDAWSFAVGQSRNYYNRLDKTAIRNIINKGDDNEFARLTSDVISPEAITDDVAAVIRGASQARREHIADVALRNILDNPNGAVAALKDWEKTNRMAFSAVFPGTKAVEARKAAAAIDTFNNSQIAKIAASKDSPVNIARTYLASPNMDQAQITQMIRAYGPEGKETLRAALMEEIIGKALKRGKEGFEVTMDSLHAAVKPYRENGAYKLLLTKDDKLALDALDVYARRILDTASDIGANLEAAAAISQMKKPSTFLSGFHELTMNKILSAALRSPPVRRAIMGSGKKPIGYQGFSIAGHIANTMIDDHYNSGDRDWQPEGKPNPALGKDMNKSMLSM